MKKTILFLLLITSFTLPSFAQITETVAARTAKWSDGLKTELMNTMQLGSEAAQKIADIEARFFSTLATINSRSELKLKEKHKELNSAHVTRRSDLQNIPLTGRQMEDVVSLSEELRRRYKL